MNEHVHEWVLTTRRDGGVGYKCSLCGSFIGSRTDEVLNRLNATERLSAEMAREIAKHLNNEKVRKITELPLSMGFWLSEYADILEGKP